MAGATFEEFTKNPDAKDFPNLLLNERQSYAVEASRIVMEIALNRLLYGKLTEKNTPAAKDKKPIQQASPAGQQKASTNPRSATNVESQSQTNSGVVSPVAQKRVPLRKAVREELERVQPRNSKGQMIDPNTKKLLKKGQIDIGHKPGQEWRKRSEMHDPRGSTRKQVLDTENDPNIYQLEDRSSNRSHKYEKKNLI